jgi:hypothetical protein
MISLSSSISYPKGLLKKGSDSPTSTSFHSDSSTVVEQVSHLSLPILSGADSGIIKWGG